LLNTKVRHELLRLFRVLLTKQLSIKPYFDMSCMNRTGGLAARATPNFNAASRNLVIANYARNTARNLDTSRRTPPKCSAFQGSALERTASVTLPPNPFDAIQFRIWDTAGRACETVGYEAEPRNQLVAISEKSRNLCYNQTLIDQPSPAFPPQGLIHESRQLIKDRGLRFLSAQRIFPDRDFMEYIHFTSPDSTS
jgi:hypothetical protein